MIDVVYLFKQFPELPQAVKEVIVDELLKLTYPDGFNDPRITASVRVNSEPPITLFMDNDDTIKSLWQE